MRLNRLLALGAFIVAALVFVPAAAQAPGWQVYENPAWGYRVQYPDWLFSLFTDAPENGGATITTPDGAARLTLFGGPNIRGGGPEAIADDLALLPDIQQVTYRRVARDWMVLSGYLTDETTGADTIFYQRVELSPDGERVAGFSLEYPVAMRGAVDHLIGAMGRSLRVY
jgi:hypothetical protein